MGTGGHCSGCVTASWGLLGRTGGVQSSERCLGALGAAFGRSECIPCCPCSDMSLPPAAHPQQHVCDMEMTNWRQCRKQLPDVGDLPQSARVKELALFGVAEERTGGSLRPCAAAHCHLCSLASAEGHQHYSGPICAECKCLNWPYFPCLGHPGDAQHCGHSTQ